MELQKKRRKEENRLKSVSHRQKGKISVQTIVKAI